MHPLLHVVSETLERDEKAQGEPPRPSEPSGTSQPRVMSTEHSPTLMGKVKEVEHSITPPPTPPPPELHNLMGKVGRLRPVVWGPRRASEALGPTPRDADSITLDGTQPSVLGFK